MWLKLTERQNRTQTKLIWDPHELYSFLATSGIEVVNLVLARDSVVLISWSYMAMEYVENLRHTNWVVGANVTCIARMQLYTYLDRLGERVMYYDIDSVKFVGMEGQHSLIVFGDSLGDMRSEQKASENISEFVIRSPINYAYKLRNSVTGEQKTVCK
jgi:hypothetical protein